MINENAPMALQNLLICSVEPSSKPPYDNFIPSVPACLLLLATTNVFSKCTKELTNDREANTEGSLHAQIEVIVIRPDKLIVVQTSLKPDIRDQPCFVFIKFRCMRSIQSFPSA